MKIELQFAEPDRQRLGVGEWVSVEIESMSIVEAIILQKGVEVGGVLIAFDSPGQWRASLAGTKREDGTSIPDWRAELVLCWLALRRTGVETDLASLTYDTDRLAWRVVTDPADPQEPGKDPSTPETTS